MSVHTLARSISVPPSSSNRKQSDAHIAADDSGRTIVEMLQRAAAKTKEDCARAMELAHKLSLQLRASEERAQELETRAAHFADRAARAENWLTRIHEQLEQTFFQEKQSSRHLREDE
jgi:hypothetical protein